MKYLLSIVLILVTTVTFTYYLLNNPNFLPVNELGEYNWVNIFTLIFLASLIIFSLLNLVIYGILSIPKKGRNKALKQEREEKQDEEIGVERGRGKEEKREGKEEKLSQKEKIIKSFKFSLILTTGLLTVFVLNFFNILNWIWGASILIVVLIFIFII
jgi:hypothetical protein